MVCNGDESMTLILELTCPFQSLSILHLYVFLHTPPPISATATKTEICHILFYSSWPERVGKTMNLTLYFGSFLKEHLILYGGALVLSIKPLLSLFLTKFHSPTFFISFGAMSSKTEEFTKHRGQKYHLRVP